MDVPAGMRLSPSRIGHCGTDLREQERNHVSMARDQLQRRPGRLPMLRLSKAPDLFSYRVEDCVLEGYDPAPAISAPVAV